MQGLTISSIEELSPRIYIHTYKVLLKTPAIHYTKKRLATVIIYLFLNSLLSVVTISHTISTASFCYDDGAG